MKDYHINIFYSEEDEGYIADIPEALLFPGMQHEIWSPFNAPEAAIELKRMLQNDRESRDRMTQCICSQGIKEIRKKG